MAYENRNTIRMHCMYSLVLSSHTLLLITKLGNFFFLKHFFILFLSLHLLFMTSVPHTYRNDWGSDDQHPMVTALCIRYLYKQQYEDFKMVVTIVIGVFSLANLMIYQQLMDALFQFLLVWYYCTLTIREQILRQNGSRIRGWWVLHHYLSIMVSACILIWPVDNTYQEFRMNFMLFSFYLSAVLFCLSNCSILSQQQVVHYSTRFHSVSTVLLSSWHTL
jgi:hypothetical protein